MQSGKAWSCQLFRASDGLDAEWLSVGLLLNFGCLKMRLVPCQ